MKLNNRILVIIIAVLLTLNYIQYHSNHTLLADQNSFSQKEIDSYNRDFHYIKTAILAQKSIYQGYIFMLDDLHSSEHNLEELKGFTRAVSVYELRSQIAALKSASIASQEIIALLDRFYKLDVLFRDELEHIPYSDLLDLSHAFAQTLPLLNNDSSEIDSLCELIGENRPSGPQSNNIIPQINAHLDRIESILQKQEAQK